MGQDCIHGIYNFIVFFSLKVIISWVFHLRKKKFFEHVKRAIGIQYVMITYYRTEENLRSSTEFA